MSSIATLILHGLFRKIGKFGVMPESDDLYVMYEPNKVNSKVELELIFFPGTASDGAYRSTWMSKDGKDCWLQTWLPKAFPTTRILAVSLLAADDEELDLELNCENLIAAITSYHQSAGRCPLILVGHCKGGLMIKKLCNKIKEKVAENTTDADQLQGFLRSVRGFAYYGTSHAGYDSEDSSSDISSRAVGRLNTAFEQFITSYGCKELALGETRPTQLCSSKPVIVDESSASHGIQRNSFFPVAADHISVCKPESPLSNSFLYLKHFIHTTMQECSSNPVIVDESSASHGIQRNSFFPVAADHISVCKPESPLSNSFLYLKHFIHTTMQEVHYRNLNVRRKKLRGRAIIISMEKKRPGSDIDRRRFVDMADYIKFCPVQILDRREQELRNIIQEKLRNEVDNEDECILCCVSAHGFISGGKQFIYDENEVPIELSAVLEPIIACPKLVGKPKVFVINACRVFQPEPPVRNPYHIMPEAEDCLLMTLERRVPELAATLLKRQVPEIHSTLSKRLSWRLR
ncbi:hypothetical protein R1sor_005734 [Riccia sorocarpa]|uniref:Caspase family p20 domain-containing protein n=1 Tax=Riccia sorocarpa TaxID=122646 RepID=A0ABD3HL26_9MARC